MHTLADIIVPPTTTAASTNQIQNALQNAPPAVKESPERLVFAAALVAAAVIGYLIADKLRNKA